MPLTPASHSIQFLFFDILRFCRQLGNEHPTAVEVCIMGLQVLYLSTKDIKEVSLSMAEIIDVVEKAFWVLHACNRKPIS